MSPATLLSLRSDLTQITPWTTPATYDPTANVRAFRWRRFSAHGDGPERGSRRRSTPVLTTQNSTVLGLTTVGTGPFLLRPTARTSGSRTSSAGSVSRVRASDGSCWRLTGVDWPDRRPRRDGGRSVAGSLSRAPSTRSIRPSRRTKTTVASNLGTNAKASPSTGEDSPGTSAPRKRPIVTPGATIPDGDERRTASRPGRCLRRDEYLGGGFGNGRLPKLDGNGVSSRPSRSAICAVIRSRRQQHLFRTRSGRRRPRLDRHKPRR
jgi:hypothetical protein